MAESCLFDEQNELARAYLNRAQHANAIVDDAGFYYDKSIKLSEKKRADLFVDNGECVIVKSEKGLETICIVHGDNTCLNDRIRLNTVVTDNLRVYSRDFVTIHKCGNVPDGSHI
ncbi:unnamed protein product [Adineta steineri]|uniref:Uncharacterized protein n=1 Tax=Adineta steineri TaxID=433720 RepID=A0A815RXJ6_9BILA|nr:unnamed protein product [Adineta steineri]CAF1638859.1 unnamed protein product [Adineta steineri]